MKVGDLVICFPEGIRTMSSLVYGIIIGFNKKGEGGKDFVKVFCEGEIMVFLSFDISLVE